MEQIQGAFFNELCGMQSRFVDWLHKYERYGTLTRNEAEFLNAMALAIQLYKDGEKPLTNYEKEQLH